MTTVWEVKCYRCSRVCGLVTGPSRPIVLLASARGVQKAPLCSLAVREDPRCDRCGGQLYTEEADGVYSIETLGSSSLN